MRKSNTAARRGRAAVAAALVIAAAAAPAANAAIPALDQRAFNIDVEGVQSTTWTLHDPSQSACDPALTGSGRERISFHSPRRERIVAKRYGTSYVLVGDPYRVGGNDLSTRAVITRSGDVQATPVAASCADSGGLGETPARDCGTKRLPYDVKVEYVNEPRHGFTLTSGDLAPVADPFRNCPWTGGVLTFPQLLAQQGKAPILAAIPVSDLFNRTYGQQIVIGRGVLHTTQGYVDATTRIRWAIRLTRASR